MQSIMARLSPRARLAVSISQALGASLEASRMEAASPRSSPGPTAADLYTGDVVAEAGRYAEWAVKLLRNEPFDVIHAHDWMTFPAAMALAAATGKPFIAHVHSTEVDRAGPHLYQPIFDIERQGMHAAQAVICVSHLTAGVCHNRYAVAEPRLHVVYNGIDPPESPRDGAGPTKAVIERTDRVVLFLGRITMQKGPEYFIAAAQKVLRVMPEVKFIMAGSGDLSREVMQLATAMGIGSRVLFTGFLRGKDVERVFQLADVYVMPSVSEPFGIAPLEAIRHDVPAIISRSSGVAEVLRHVLKVDFWNTDDMADKIVAVLRHEPLSRSLRENAELEVRQLTWDGAAAHCVELYESLVAGR
jgi:glycosyltransferase involved in cell wall biosynthesis